MTTVARRVLTSDRTITRRQLVISHLHIARQVTRLCDQPWYAYGESTGMQYSAQEIPHHVMLVILSTRGVSKFHCYPHFEVHMILTQATISSIGIIPMQCIQP